MKIRHSLSIFGLVAMLGLGAGVGLANANKSANKVQAESSSAEAGTRIYICDENDSNWTGNNQDPIIHMYGITLDDDLTVSELNSLSASFGDSVTWNVGSSEADAVMNWAGMNNNHRSYEIKIPWYFESFSVCFYTNMSGNNTYLKYKDGGVTIDYSLQRGNELTINISGGDSTAYSGSGYYVNINDNSFDYDDVDYTYAQKHYDITATAGAGGTTTGTGTYKEFENVTITAIPSGGYSFAGWSDSGAASHEVRAAGDAEYTASFNNLPQLAAPTLSISDNVVTWTAVANATKYSVQINSETPYDVATNEAFSVPAKIVPGSYEVKVTAIGDHTSYNDSNTSTKSYTIDAGYYLVGTFNSWDSTNLIGAVKFVDGAISSIHLAANAKVQAVYHNGTPAWQGTNSVSMDAEALADYPVEKDGDDVKFTREGNYSIAFNSETKVYTVVALDFTLSYKLYVGETEYTLVKGNGTEYVASNVTLNAGDVLSYKRNGVAQDSTAKAVNNNNLTSAKKVVFNTVNATVYVDVSNGTIWTGQNASSGYHMTKNGTLVTLTHGEDYDGFIQYYSALITFAQNDIVRFADVSSTSDVLPVVFDVTKINPADLGSNFEVVDGNIKCKTACNATVYLKLKSGNDEIYFGPVSEAVRLAKEFAEDFTTAIGGVCVYAGTTPIEGVGGLAEAWQTQKGLFTTLNTNKKDAADVLRDALTEASSVQEIKDFIAMYIYVAEKYNTRLGEGYNFLGAELNIKSAVISYPFQVQESNSYTLIIVAVASSIAVLVLIGGYFYFRKRKEDR